MCQLPTSRQYIPKTDTRLKKVSIASHRPAGVSPSTGASTYVLEEEDDHHIVPWTKIPRCVLYLLQYLPTYSPSYLTSQDLPPPPLFYPSPLSDVSDERQEEKKKEKRKKKACPSKVFRWPETETHTYTTPQSETYSYPASEPLGSWSVGEAKRRRASGSMERPPALWVSWGMPGLSDLSDCGLVFFSCFFFLLFPSPFLLFSSTLAWNLRTYLFPFSSRGSYLSASQETG